MADDMTPDRFRALAAAYGGSIERWPEASRQPAAALAGQSWARAALLESTALDATLDRWTLPNVEQHLIERIAASAPEPRRRFVASARLWWSGVGVAATLAGTVAGTAAVAAFAPVQSGSEPATAFGDFGRDQSQ